MFSSENEVNRLNGSVRTSAGVLSVVEITRMTGISVSVAIAISRMCSANCPGDRRLAPATRCCS